MKGLLPSKISRVSNPHRSRHPEASYSIGNSASEPLRAYWEYNSARERYYGVTRDDILVGSVRLDKTFNTWTVFALPDGEDGIKQSVGVFEDAMEQRGLRRALALLQKSNRTAATISDIEQHTAVDVQKRARGVKVSLARADQKNGIWTFHAKGSHGEKYTVRIKAEAKGNTKDVAKLPVKVSCDCEFFRFQGSEHWGVANQYLYGQPLGTASAPSTKDPEGRNWACKHVMAAFKLANQYRIASDSASLRLLDAVPVPDMVSRIAGRFLSTA